MSIEAIKQALEALESVEPWAVGDHDPFAEAITALRAAIAEAVMQRLTDVHQEMGQKPVAWKVAGEVSNWAKDFSAYQTKTYVEPVYTHPPRREWVGLTEVAPSVEQLDQIIDLLARTHVRISARELLRVWIVAYTRAIEAKLKEKNS
jgi:hypothetical protein